MFKFDPILFPAMARLLIRHADHVCASNARGVCASCASGPSLLLGASSCEETNRRSVKRLRAVRAYLAAFVATETRARFHGLDSVASALVKLHDAKGPVSALSARLDVYQGEVDRFADAITRRAEKAAAKAAKADARAVLATRERIALRLSDASDWRVFVTFRSGAHDVLVARAGSEPRGYQEARVSRKVRGDSEGLAYGDRFDDRGRRTQGAESLAQGLAASLSRNGTSRKARARRRRA